MTREDDLIEADRLGLLSGQMKTDFDYAIKNGIITPPNAAVNFSIVEALKNVPTSAYKYGSDVLSGLSAFSPVGERKPEDAPFNLGEQDDEWGFRKLPIVDSLGKLASGFAQKLAAGDSEHAVYSNPENVAAADAVGEHYSDRYGSVDNFKRTAMKDPIGVLADLSIPVTMGGSAIAKTGQLSKTSQLSQLGKALKTGGQALDPVGAIALAAKPAYGMGARPTLAPAADDLGDFNRMVDRGFDANVTMDEAGIDKIARITGAEMRKRNAILDDIPETFPVERQFDALEPVYNDLTNPRSKARRSLSVDEGFDRAVSTANKELADQLRGGKSLSARELNELKSRWQGVAADQGAYRGEPRMESIAGIDQQLYETLGRSAKETLETAAGAKGPELSRLNSQYGIDKKMGRALSRALGKEHPQFGIDYSVRSGLTASGVGSKPAVAIGALAANFGGPKLVRAALALKDSPMKKAIRQLLIQEGRSEKEINKAIEDLKNGS